MLAAANNNDYLVFQQTNSGATTGIMTRAGASSSDVGGYIIRYGGSVGDYTGADIEEDSNNIDVVLGLKQHQYYCYLLQYQHLYNLQHYLHIL